MSKFQPPAKSETSITLPEVADPARDLIKSLAQEIRNALPIHLTPERVGRIALTEIRKAPKLLKCDRQSLAAAIIQSAQLGLELGSGLGLAYLIPYGTEARFQIGYQGLIELARRSGKLIAIEAEVVYKDDEWDVQLGPEKKLYHRPKNDRRSRPSNEEIVGAYSVADLPNPAGGPPVRQWKWMWRYEIDYIRSLSKQPNGDTWVLHFPAMCKKTVIIQHCKFLPKSAELARAINLDNSAEHGNQDLVGDLAGGPDVVTIDVEPSEPPPADEKKPRTPKAPPAPPVAPGESQEFLDRITAHVNAKHFTLAQVKEFAKTDNIAGMSFESLKELARDLDGLAAAEGSK